MDFQQVLSYYSRKDVQEALLEEARDREVVGVFADGSFGKRPDVLIYPNDILQAVRSGCVAFHASVERWENPLRLEAGMLKHQQDELRKGWDLLLDPDVKDFEFAKVATLQLIEALEDFGVRSYGIKFSGGRGFHLIVPFEALPQEINFQPASKLYPELSEKIVRFLEWYVRDMLRDSLLSFAKEEEIARRVGKNLEEILTHGKFDPFKVVKLDVFGSRHLFRMPYSLNEKTLLVSLPLDKNQLKKFEKEDARPERISVSQNFVLKASAGEAEALVVEALDFSKISEKELPPIQPARRKRVRRKIPEELFPPCIKQILQGLSDGRKRSVFVLATFLRSVGWSSEEIEKKIFEWNEKNLPPLRASYLRTQLRWHFRQEREILPPNCDNPVFYKDFVSQACSACLEEIKNPVNYPFKLQRKRIKTL